MGGTKIRPGITINWRISSQFDSNILQLLGIPGRILVPPVAQIFVKMTSFFLSVHESFDFDLMRVNTSYVA